MVPEHAASPRARAPRSADRGATPTPPLQVCAGLGAGSTACNVWYAIRMLTAHEPNQDAQIVARALARWLAPYLAEELQGVATPRADAPAAISYDDRYDMETCERYVSTLGDVVLDNAERFFKILADHGEVGSLALATALEVNGPRNISAVLTTPLKRRAKALSLPYPWEEAVSPDDRTIWRDPTGTCKRLLGAITRERERRHLPARRK